MDMDMLSSLLSSDSAEKARAEVLLAHDVAERLDASYPELDEAQKHELGHSEWDGRAAYRPEHVPELPYSMRSVKPKDAWANDDLRPLLGEHLRRVTAIEGRNAARLRTLLWAVHVLRREGEEQMARRVHDWTASRYRIRRALVTEGAHERRQFATRMARNYEALPKAWRDE